jgi:hypothetical protein
MYNNAATEAIMSVGMKALREALGALDIVPKRSFSEPTR